uniref:Uncharacterized membrane protein n=1 Tax=Candidatus Kentrum sp. TC TaxID=2126339 RepID=A0A451A8Z8_9GAMM|nr:MAG: Uncharacterized membrane protein [Candidatus Kentron sp. TC]VFK49533.1 MAG: Uncharacterized membrane protein [Candidatus Kentron sp. TC]VFK62491.1 MAG: Uncharacterized membrane protein [Candidatus Kentron sp. TC]
MNRKLFHANDEKTKSVKRIATIVYALQAASILFGITFIIAIIVNYVKKEDARGTWLESHFRWQIRTFWFSILWHFLGWITIFVAGYLVFFLTFIWIIYRVVKGWIHLVDGKEMYV